MNAEFTLGSAAGLIADPARSAILTLLLSGRAHTAGELALAAEISAQNASGHLQKLLTGNLIAVEVSGRHRYYRLASPEVGFALESIAAINPVRDRIHLEPRQLSEMRFCRTCYDHLAGIVAIGITTSLIAHQAIHETHQDFSVTQRGEIFFSTLGIDIQSLLKKRHALARKCLDWTERKPHIGGSLGNAILERLTELTWIAPVRGSRAMRVTAKGQERLIAHFGKRVLCCNS